MRDLRELNLNEGGRPVDRAPPTPEEIERFERFFGVRLPPDYLALLAFSNGGHPELDAFIPKGSESEEIWGVNRFLKMRNDDPYDLESVWGATDVWRRVTNRNVVAIANNGGGDYVLLSYDVDPPRVTICLHEEQLAMIHVADSFAEFIDMLFLDPDMI